MEFRLPMSHSFFSLLWCPCLWQMNSIRWSLKVPSNPNLWSHPLLFSPSLIPCFLLLPLSALTKFHMYLAMSRVLWWAQNPFTWHCAAFAVQGFNLRPEGFFQSAISLSFCSVVFKWLSAACFYVADTWARGVSSRWGEALWRKLPSPHGQGSTGAGAASAAGGQLEIFAIPLLWLPQKFCYLCCVFIWVQAQTLENHLGAHTWKPCLTPGQLQVTLTVCVG